MKKRLPLLVLSLLILQTTTFATNYYFSVLSGDDSRTSIQAQNSATPWKTISKLNAFFPGIIAGDSILFKRGETWSGSNGGTIRIGASGTAASQIVIAGYGTGARPVISGLTPLTWMSLGGNFWRSNELLAPDSINVVTVNNLITQMGRWPNLTNGNGGYNTIKTAIDSFSFTQKDTTPELAGHPAYFVNAQVVYRASRFHMERERITAWDSITHTITFAYRNNLHDSPPLKGFGYFIQDDSLTLDVQNEWWFKKNSYIKIYSAGSPSNVSAAVIDTLLTSKDMSFVTIDSINFNGCNADAIYLIGGSDIVIRKCIIQNAGRNGIKTLSTNSSILNDSIVNICSKGVIVTSGGDPTHGNRAVISNNIIRNLHQLVGHGNGTIEDGKSNQSGVGVYMPGAFGHTVDHNTIINAGYNGIHFIRNDSVIVRRNYIDTVCNVMDDGGGIYTYTGPFDTAERARKITGNIILHGIGAPYGKNDPTPVPGEGVAGIYNDRGSNNIDIDSNTVSGFIQGIFENYGANRNNIRYNNLYDNATDIQINTRLANGDTSRNLYITRNVAYAAENADTTIQLHSDDGDVLNRFGTIDSNYYARPTNDSITMTYQTNKGVANIHPVSLAGWQTAFPIYDANSRKAPRKVFDTSQIKFAYNATNTNKTISLGGYNYIGVDSTKYFQNIILKPYTSIILLKDTNVVLKPLADAYVRDGTAYAGVNYGTNDSLQSKKSSTSLNRSSYLKFSINNISGVLSAKLRVYGKNTSDATTVYVSAFGVSDDTWTETGITWNNRPPVSGIVLDSVGVNDQPKYYELDVTSFVKAQLSIDTLVSFVLKDSAITTALPNFNSRDQGQNPPQLVIITPAVIGPLADAFVRDTSVAGAFANSNFGSNDSLIVKGSSSKGFTRFSYLKFPVNTVGNVTSAKLRLYGNNTENTATVTVSVFGVNNDSWSESGITWNSQVGYSNTAITSTGVNNTPKYYEFDVTNFVKNQLDSDKIAGFVLKDLNNADKTILFNSKEQGQNPPQLVIDYSGGDLYPIGRRGAYVNNSLVIKPLESITGKFEDVFSTAKVYPNPAYKSFIIAFPGNYKGDFGLQITDMQGRTWNLGNQNLPSGTTYARIDISKLALPPGIYYLTISSETRKTEVIKMMMK